MLKPRQQIALLISLLIVITCFWYAESFAIKRTVNYHKFHSFSIIDTLKRSQKASRSVPTTSKERLDTLLQVQDSLKKDSLKKDTLQKPKGALEDIVKYKAKDSIVFNKVRSEIILYNETQVQYCQ